MYSPEFKAKALRIIDECGGSCIKASRRIGVVSPKTLKRLRDESKKKPRKRYAHLSRTQKRRVARQIERGTSVQTLSDRHGVSVTTIYNIRNEYRQEGALLMVEICIAPKEIADRWGLAKCCRHLQLDA